MGLALGCWGGPWYLQITDPYQRSSQFCRFPNHLLNKVYTPLMPQVFCGKVVLVNESPAFDIMETEPIRIVIADQNRLYRETLCRTIENEANLQVVTFAEDGLSAIQAVERHQPDVVIMDISMQTINGLDATWVIRHRFPSVKVILLSAYDMQAAMEASCKMGASCCLGKGCSPKELIQAIRTAAN